jgi:polo-like kinase 1
VRCPRVITEYYDGGDGAKRARRYIRGRALGKGGFAVVFAVQEAATGRSFACKVVAKSTLEKPRARKKMVTEIRIHKSVSCDQVVRFERCFEDDNHVYILMEMCSNRTLADIVKSRGAMREMAAACYMREAVSATAHLHAMRVIHRDLKLGNLFLTKEGLEEIKAEGGGPGTDAELNRLGAAKRVKIGDFGLACAMDHDDERRRTICGTPNYIAPEVLKGKEGPGHSYEVDTWSLGVILYTLLFGSPPFQTKDVKLTYKRIRANEYDIPDDPPIADSTKDLIRAALSAEPEKRPTLQQIAAHPFMKLGAEDWKLADEKPAPYVERRSKTTTVSSPKKPVTKSRRLDARDGDTICAEAPSKATNPSAATQQLRSPLQSLDQNRLTAGAHARAMERDVVAVESASNGLLATNRCREPEYASASTDGDIETGHPTSLLGDKLDSLQLRTDSEDESRAMASYFPHLWVDSWVDFTSKYGMGYKLSDGTIGVAFNDDTRMMFMEGTADSPIVYMASPHSQNPDPPIEDTVIDPEKARALGSDFGRMLVYPAEARKYGRDVAKKVLLAGHFREYLSDTKHRGSVYQSIGGLSHDGESRARDPQTMPPYVKSWLRTSKGVMWRLSNKTIQVNFYDEREILLSPTFQLVVHTDPVNDRRTVHSLDSVPESEELLVRSLQHIKDALPRLVPSARAAAAPPRVADEPVA